MVSRRKGVGGKLPRARNLCQQFVGTLAPCAHAGVGALSAAHSALIVGRNNVACSINLDACRQSADPHGSRWDYLLVVGQGTGPVVGMEVHHAVSAEVSVMIKKKNAAMALLRQECPTLTVQSWNWIVPKGQTPFFTQNDPLTRTLYAAGIGFPKSSLVIL